MEPWNCRKVLTLSDTLHLERLDKKKKVYGNPDHYQPYYLPLKLNYEGPIVADIHDLWSQAVHLDVSNCGLLRVLEGTVWVTQGPHTVKLDVGEYTSIPTRRSERNRVRVASADASRVLLWHIPFQHVSTTGLRKFAIESLRQHIVGNKRRHPIVLRRLADHTELPVGKWNVSYDHWRVTWWDDFVATESDMLLLCTQGEGLFVFKSDGSKSTTQICEPGTAAYVKKGETFSIHTYKKDPVHLDVMMHHRRFRHLYR